MAELLVENSKVRRPGLPRRLLVDARQHGPIDAGHLFDRLVAKKTVLRCPEVCITSLGTEVDALEQVAYPIERNVDRQFAVEVQVGQD